MNKPTKKQLTDRVAYLEQAIAKLINTFGPEAGLTAADIEAHVASVLEDAPSLTPAPKIVVNNFSTVQVTDGEVQVTIKPVDEKLAEALTAVQALVEETEKLGLYTDPTAAELHPAE